MSARDEQLEDTLRVPLTPELAFEVSDRVRRGSYSFETDFALQAVRLLLALEQAPEQNQSRFADRLRAASDLQTLGLEMTIQRLQRGDSSISNAELRDRVHAMGIDDDAGPGLRAAPERLKRLRRHGQEDVNS